MKSCKLLLSVHSRVQITFHNFFPFIPTVSIGGVYLSVSMKPNGIWTMTVIISFPSYLSHILCDWSTTSHTLKVLYGEGNCSSRKHVSGKIYQLHLKLFIYTYYIHACTCVFICFLINCSALLSDICHFVSSFIVVSAFGELLISSCAIPLHIYVCIFTNSSTLDISSTRNCKL